MKADKTSFKTWVFYLWHLVILVFLSFPITAMAWAMTRTPETGGAIVIWLFLWLAVFFFGLISVLFTRIEVDAEGVTIKTPFSFGRCLFYSFDELRQAKWRMCGRAVNFSGTISDYFIVPLRYKELAEEISQRPRLGAAVPRVPKRLDYAISIVPIFLLALVIYAFRFRVFGLNPLIYGTLWGIVAFISQSVFVHRSWSRYRYRNLGRLGSALAYGLMTAVPFFVLNLLLVFL